jgi:UDP-N-acetylmuramate--alanine ligase
VVDDYGHHPTEIKATLNAAKSGAHGRRLVVLFQPHRYTRTQDLLEEFARSFNNADVLYLLDIYAASEDPIPGVTAEVLAEEIKKYGHKNVHYIGSLDNAANILAANAQPNDLVITLGAGTIYRAGEQLLEMLKEKDANNIV